MKANVLALLVGGLIPAVLFGVSAVFQKTSIKAGLGAGPYLVILGLIVVAAGAVVTAVQGDASVTWAGAAHACVSGVLWAAAVAGVVFAVARLDGQISQLVPLYNMNTLVAVAVGLVALAEWRNVQAALLLPAAVLTVAGGVLAAASVR